MQISIETPSEDLIATAVNSTHEDIVWAQNNGKWFLPTYLNKLLANFMYKDTWPLTIIVTKYYKVF